MVDEKYDCSVLQASFFNCSKKLSVFFGDGPRLLRILLGISSDTSRHLSLQKYILLPILLATLVVFHCATDRLRAKRRLKVLSFYFRVYRPWRVVFRKTRIAGIGYLSIRVVLHRVHVTCCKTRTNTSDSGVFIQLCPI